MSRLIVNGPFRIEQEEVVLFSDFEEDGKMWAGRGARTTVVKQTFSEPFRSLPAVQCALSMWDMDSAFNARFDIRAESITEESFDIVFRTWGDTRIARVRATWIAIGEAPSNDNWEVY